MQGMAIRRTEGGRTPLTRAFAAMLALASFVLCLAFGAGQAFATEEAFSFVLDKDPVVYTAAPTDETLTVTFQGAGAETGRVTGASAEGDFGLPFTGITVTFDDNHVYLRGERAIISSATLHVTAQNDNGAEVQKNFDITSQIEPPLPPLTATVTPSEKQNPVVNQLYNQEFRVNFGMEHRSNSVQFELYDSSDRRTSSLYGLQVTQPSLAADKYRYVVSGTPTTTGTGYIKVTCSRKFGEDPVVITIPLEVTEVALPKPLALELNAQETTALENKPVDFELTATATGEGSEHASFSAQFKGDNPGLYPSIAGEGASRTITFNGLPNRAGDFTLQVSVQKDIDSDPVVKEFVFHVNERLGMTVTPSSLQKGTVGTPYRQQLTVSFTGHNAAGAAITEARLSSTRDHANDGLSVETSGNTITISGTPENDGDVTLFINARNESSDEGTGTEIRFQIDPKPVVQLAVSLDRTTLPNATVGTEYHQVLTMSKTAGSVDTWSITGWADAGKTGLKLTKNDADKTYTISGTPTNAGTFTLYPGAWDSVTERVSLAPVTVTVTAPESLGLNLSAEQTTLLENQVTDFSLTATATGDGAESAIFSTAFEGDGPGLTPLVEGTGATRTISFVGKPNKPGEFTLKVSVKKDEESAPVEKSVIFHIQQKLGISATPSALENGTVGTSYHQEVTISFTGQNATGAQITEARLSSTDDGANDGLNASHAGNVVTITGTPTTPGMVKLLVNARNESSNEGAGLELSFEIKPKPYEQLVVSLDKLELPDATVGVEYNQVIKVTKTAGSANDFELNGWLDAGKTGLKLAKDNQAKTYTISGTPVAAGTVTLHPSARDNIGVDATLPAITFQVNEAAPVPAPVPAEPLIGLTDNGGNLGSKVIKINKGEGVGDDHYIVFSVTAQGPVQLSIKPDYDTSFGLTPVLVDEGSRSVTVTKIVKIKGKATKAGTFVFGLRATVGNQHYDKEIRVEVANDTDSPEPGPGPQPGPAPGPAPEPGPGPQPDPAPAPGPAPEPGPGPQPGPAPAPAPGPAPSPAPGPAPAPAPAPGPAPAPAPTPAPKPSADADTNSAQPAGAVSVKPTGDLGGMAQASTQGMMHGKVKVTYLPKTSDTTSPALALVLVGLGLIGFSTVRLGARR